MHYLDESHILLFLVQVLVLLATARTLGALCEEVKVPAITGEILAGVVLGPTLFGRVAPGLQSTLFPDDLTHATMLETVSWLGVFFLLLASGFHVDARAALKRGRAALSVGVVGVLVPIAIGWPLFAALAPRYWGARTDRLGFSLFLAVAASITAISVVARAIRDKGLLGRPEGNLALAACAVNDIFGWFLFTVVLAVATTTELDLATMGVTGLSTIGFVLVTLLAGSRVMGVAVKWVRSTNLGQPEAVMTLVVTAGLLCGIITQFLGIHAILGFFLAGTMAGSAPGVSQELKSSLSDSLHAIFVPLFFATLGLKIDFVTGMEVGITALFLGVAVVGKFLGAWLGARLVRLSGASAALLGLVFVPGGAMEIVVGTLAMELQLIREPVFVAIVFAALASSILVGPLIAWQVRRMDTA